MSQLTSTSVRNGWQRIFLNASLAIALTVMATDWGARFQQVLAQERAASQYLLLHSGQLLQGVVTPSGDTFQVKMGSGIEMTVDAEEVEFRGTSLEALFRHQKGKISPRDVQQQLALANWCLRYELLEYAERQLLALSDLGADETIRLRLRDQIISLHQQRRSAESAGRGNATRAAPAAYQTNAHDNGGLEMASVRDLNRLVRSLPEGSFQVFNRQVQGPLIQGCGAASCHDHDARKLALNFVRVGSALPRKTSQRNLRQALQYVDRQAPDASPLYQMAISAHGNSLQATWPEDSPHAKKLKQWIYSVAGQPLPPTNAAAGGSGPPINPGAFAGTEGVGSAERSTPEDRADKDILQSLTVPPSPRNPLESMPTGESPSADPFDPEVFNRRYGLGDQPDSRKGPDR